MRKKILSQAVQTNIIQITSNYLAGQAVIKWNLSPEIMKKFFRLILLTPLWLACNSNDSSEFGIEPALVSYDDDAPALRKSYCADANCTEIMNEDRFSYNAQGNITLIENAGRNPSGGTTVYQYSEYAYDPSGLLKTKTEYIKDSKQENWIVFNITEYDHEAGLIKSEKLYNYQTYAGQKTLLRSIVHEYAAEKKSGQRYYDAQGKLSYRVEYGYKNGVLNFETWYDASDKANRTFEHKFAGNSRQIGEYLIGSRELLAMIEKTYDDQGRLLTQETKVNNPLLCALPPGKILFSY